MPNFKFNFDYVPVSREFIEHYMPAANPAYVVIYLYIMNLSTENRTMDTSEIAKKLNFLESDVVNAIKYWNDKGIISEAGDTIVMKHSADEIVPPEVMRKSVDEVAKIIDANPDLADLCSIAQEMLGKTLGNNDLETLYWFYDQLGFTPEVITMLLEYCVSMNKRNMKYIEKVAITWHENNITTMDEASAFITGAAKHDEFETSLCQLFGIAGRKLSKTEKMYLSTWQSEYSMSADMVGLAYEYCIIATNKLSFPYINSILKRWTEKGIHTIADAEADHNSYKQSADGHEMSPTTDIDELEKQFMASYENN